MVVGLDPTVYCTCGQCEAMPTLEESVCCNSITTSIDKTGIIIFLSIMKLINLDTGCINEDDLIEMILNPVILELTLRNVWSMDKSGSKEESLSNE